MMISLVKQNTYSWWSYILVASSILHLFNRGDYLHIGQTQYVLINQGILNSGVSFNKSSTVVDVVSHLVLQVHLGPTGE